MWLLEQKLLNLTPSTLKSHLLSSDIISLFDAMTMKLEAPKMEEPFFQLLAQINFHTTYANIWPTYL
jgi:hypothetical protein